MTLLRTVNSALERAAVRFPSCTPAGRVLFFVRLLLLILPNPFHPHCFFERQLPVFLEIVDEVWMSPRRRMQRLCGTSKPSRERALAAVARCMWQFRESAGVA